MWTCSPSDFRRTKRLRVALACASLTLALNAGLAVAHGATVLRFGVYTADKPTTMVQRFRPVLNVLEKKVSAILHEDVKISLSVAPSYTKGLDDLVSGHIDISQFGPASYIHAKQLNPNIAILAIEGHHGKKIFYGIICVPTDSPIHDVSQLAHKSFAFGNKSSTIGRYLSQLYLLEHGIAARDLKAYSYLGRHDLVGTAVGRHDFDAGALKDSTFARLVARGVKIREIARFPNVAKPWIASSEVSPSMRHALTQALLSIHDPTALKALGATGFLRGTDADYAVIRRALSRDAEFFGREAANRAP